jgi:hypothetical protein
MARKIPVLLFKVEYGEQPFGAQVRHMLENIVVQVMQRLLRTVPAFAVRISAARRNSELRIFIINIISLPAHNTPKTFDNSSTTTPNK